MLPSKSLNVNFNGNRSNARPKIVQRVLKIKNNIQKIMVTKTTSLTPIHSATSPALAKAVERPITRTAVLCARDRFLAAVLILKNRNFLY